jgi:hypothetical protein
MAQTNYTPIQLYYSTTAAAVPLAANLAQGELAINIADGKLYYENSSGVVTLLASSTTVTNSFSAGTTGFTPSTATTGAVTLAGTLITSNGGTGLSSYTAGDLSYYASGTALTKLAIGTAGQFLTSTGTAPQWSTLSGVAVTTFSAGTTGFTPSSATSGAVTLAGTLATTNGGTGLTSFTSGGVVYASSSSALATGSALTFDGSTFGVTGAATVTGDISTTSTGRLNLRGSGTGVNYDFQLDNDDSFAYFRASRSNAVTKGYVWYLNNSTTEGMRLTSTGLGIGTSSPAYPLTVAGDAQFGSNATVPTVIIGKVTPTANGDAGIQFRHSNTTKNWSISSNRYASAGLEFTPSTTNGGTTYTTPAMILDTSGNLGLGVTPAAWNTSWKALQIGTIAALFSQNSNTYLSNNEYINSAGDPTYLTSSFATRYLLHSTGEHRWYNASSGTAGNTISFTQAMTLSASGYLGIAQTSPTTFLDILGSNNLARFNSPSTQGTYILFANAGVAKGYIGNSNQLITSGSTDNFAIRAEGLLQFTAGGTGTAQATIDASGNLLVGTTASTTEKVRIIQSVANNVLFIENSNATTVYGMQIYYSGKIPNNVGEDFVYCGDTSPRFVARSNGGLANYSANNVNLSDRREKTNFAPAKSYLDVICAIPVQTFNYIDQNMEEDGGLTLGVVAQDVQAVAPELVMESNWANRDAEPKMRLSIYQTDLQYALMKCIQEQQALIQSLKARLDAANL